MKSILLNISETILNTHSSLTVVYEYGVLLFVAIYFIQIVTWPWLLGWTIFAFMFLLAICILPRFYKFHKTFARQLTHTFFPYRSVDPKSHAENKQYEELRVYNNKLEKKIEEHTKHLADLYQELSLANQDIEIFLYKAYHNFLGPIATIRGVCNIAMLEGEQHIDYFQKVGNVADNMQTMLEKLLEISYIHHCKPELISIQLHELFAQLKKDNEKDALLSSLQLVQLFKPESNVHADHFLLKNAIDKIIKGNTRFWSQNRFPEREIHVNHSQDINYNIISIQERHLSVPPESLNNLFTMFYRSSSKPEDHGLEFYTARYALRRMGGDISITSTSGFTTFNLHLPRFRTKRYNDLQAILKKESHLQNIL
ncbi:HAMP domain-containing sensor histidine kinase [Porifericola rhodea]|uniref:sensor histidine kinase n=1 Tax=Porifericola rhodea TaxID=930972 RepID=UPI00266677E1|nr:HAMP domain-containing sensor histidine kinase [Porifericola rhodea]WKN33693.1 HAMP domain-containing sensor histidine kinase [Porifericola rhodea]